MSIKSKDKVKQVLITCKCGKKQYVREDSNCAYVGLCSNCLRDEFTGIHMPQAPK